MNRTLVALGLAASACTWAQTPLVPVAAVNDLALTWNHVGMAFASRCGSDWLMIEEAAWKCVRQTPQGKLAVVDFGPMPTAVAGLIVLREPVAGDARLLFTESGGFNPGGSVVRALDPVTFAVSELGNLFDIGSPGPSPMLVDANGDGVKDVLLRGQGQASDTIVTLPGGIGVPSQILRTLPFRPVFSGQFDADTQSELAVLDDNFVLRFYDAATLLLEPYQPQGSYHAGPGEPSVVADWDADGIDEIAIQRHLGGVGLIDPNGSTTPIQVTIPNSGPNEPLAMVNWQGQNSRDLAIWSRQRVQVVNPRSGAVLAQFEVPKLVGADPYMPISVDWDRDGDDDLAWIQQVNSRAIWLLRNGGGIEVQQQTSLAKRVVGNASVGAQSQLVTLELFDAQIGSDLRLRRRDPQTLALLGDAQIEFGNFTSDSFALADLHPQTGIELLQGDQRWLRLYALDGTLLWARENVDPLNRRFRFAVAPDSTCTGAGCQRILVLDEIQSGIGEPDRIRLLDSAANGNELWSGATSATSFMATVGLSDLSGDGVPELFYTEHVLFEGTRLVVRDGVDRSLRWQIGNIEPVQIQRTNDAKRRLTVFTSSREIVYLDPDDGSVLRSIPLNAPGTSSCFSACEIRYLSQGETVGLWVVTRTTDPLRTVRRDLRGIDWGGGAGYAPTGIATLGPHLVNMASYNSVYAFEVGADGIFVDEFEGW